jgi:hypothetical protein
MVEMFKLVLLMLNDGLHIKVNHKNHGMYFTQKELRYMMFNLILNQLS